jgi:hypothetical protein
MTTPEKYGPQLSWTNIIASVVMIAVLVTGGYKIIESEFDYVRQSSAASFADLNKQIMQNRADIAKVRDEYLTLREHSANQQGDSDVNIALRNRLSTLEAQQHDLIAHQAHVPVEGKEVDQLSASVDKRFELLQQQINDINRQIAASVLQSGTPIHPAPPLLSR